MVRARVCCHSRKPYINGWTNRGAVRGMDLGGTKQPCVRWGPRSPRGRSNSRGQLLAHCKVQGISSVSESYLVDGSSDEAFLWVDYSNLLLLEEQNICRYPQLLLQLRILLCQLLQPQLQRIGTTMKLILQLSVPPFQLRDPHLHHVPFGNQCSACWVVFGGTLQMYAQPWRQIMTSAYHVNNVVMTYKINIS